MQVSLANTQELRDAKNCQYKIKIKSDYDKNGKRLEDYNEQLNNGIRVTVGKM